MQDYNINKVAANELLAVIIVAFIGYVFLVLRNSGVEIFLVDELVYIADARYRELSKSHVPSYLYSWVFSFTGLCGEDFRDCAREINSFMHVLTILPMYFVGRRWLTPALSLLISGCFAASAINFFTVLFWPETFYYFIFWCFIAVFFSALNVDTKSYTLKEWCCFVLSGCLFAALCMIKVHALLIIPTFLFFILLCFFYQQTRVLVKGLIIFLMSAMIARFILGFVLTGGEYLPIFGELYGSIASSKTNVELSRFLHAVLINSIGHLQILCIGFGLPLTVLLIMLVKVFNNRFSLSHLNIVHVFSIILLLNLVCVVVLFSAKIFLLSPETEPITRLHTRYYQFVLPLLVILACAYVYRKSETSFSIFKYVFTVLVLIVLGYCLSFGLKAHLPNLFDNPLFSSVRISKFDDKFIITFAAMMASLLIVFLFKERLAMQAYIYIMLPLFLLFGGFQASKIVSHQRTQHPITRLGNYYNFQVGLINLPSTAVVYDSQFDLYHASVSLDADLRSHNKLYLTQNIDQVDPEVRWIIDLSGKELQFSGYRDLVQFSSYKVLQKQ